MYMNKQNPDGFILSFISFGVLCSNTVNTVRENSLLNPWCECVISLPISSSYLKNVLQHFVTRITISKLLSTITLNISLCTETIRIRRNSKK